MRLTALRPKTYLGAMIGKAALFGRYYRLP
jgi:hypothetical protein